MNKTYSIIFNAALGEYQVVSEKTKTRRSKARKLVSVALLGALLTPAFAQLQPPFDIEDNKAAIIVRSNDWADYDFQTTATDDQFFPIYSSVVGSEDNWSTRLEAYVLDPTNQTNKDNFDVANSTLQTNVNNYFTAGNGYLKVNTDKTFGFIAKANTTNISNIANGELIAVSVGKNISLKYMSDNQLGETSYYTNRLFNIASNGTLIMQTDAGASIEINGFGINEPGWTNGGAISNAGNAYFGSSVKFIDNVVYSYNGGVIYNTGSLHIGSSAEFSSNRAENGGAIYNNTGGNVYIGSNATFGNNSASTSDVYLYGGGAIYNYTGNIYIGSNATFSNNSASGGGAIHNNARGNVYIGSNATFGNNSAFGGGAIFNVGNIKIGNGAVFFGNQVGKIINGKVYGGLGGALYNEGGNVYIGSNATFSNNSVLMSAGGAILNSSALGNVYIGSNATFSNNFASAGGGAIYNNGNLNIDTGTYGETTLFTGNLENGRSNSIAMGSGTLNITGDGILDMRDPFSSFSSTINKSGTSTWKLGGESLGGYVDSNNVLQRFATLNINEGTLYLYKAGEVYNNHYVLNPNFDLADPSSTYFKKNPNYNPKDPNSSPYELTTEVKVGAGNIKDLFAMKLGSSANLIAGGGNTLSGGTLTLEDGTTIGFKVGGDPGSVDPIMEWNFNNLLLDGQYWRVDIMGMPYQVGQYYLLKNNAPSNFTVPTLTYFGFDSTSLDRIANKFTLMPVANANGASNDLYLNVSGEIKAGQATWNNRATTATWDVITRNWTIDNTTYTQFLPGDAVVFGNLGLAQQTININASKSKFELNGMTVDSSTNYTFNGDGLALMAGKNITKNGTGVLAFNNRVKGDVALQGGKLIIGDSSLNKNAYLEGTVTAQLGTTVGGHGTIAGAVNISNGAILSPGNSIGTITVGELNLQDGARVVLDVLPTGESDKIVVKRLGATSGNVTIGQNVMLNIMAGAGQWAPSTSYSFMTAEGTISGRFAGVTSNLAFLTGVLNANSAGFNLINTSASGGSNEIVIDFNRNNVAFATFAETYNQRAVANAVEFIPQDHAVYKAIVSMSGEQARLAYDNLSGELYASTENVLFHNASKLQDGMLSRIHEGTDGLWIKGWGHNSHIKGDGNADKVENKGAGLLLGYDFNLNQNILIGAAVGFEDSKIKIKDHNRKGENKVKSTHFMVYGNADLEVLEVKAGLSYSALRFKANRYINIPTLAGNLHSKYHGHQIHAFIEASKTFNVLENYDVAPYVNLAYTDVKTKSFVEEGSQAGLSARGQSNNRTSLTIGVKNDWYFDTERNLGVTADIGWKHTFGDKTIDKRFNFVNTNTDFRIRSASVNKNSAVIGIGFKGKYQDLTIDVGYQGEFNNKVKDHAFGAKVKWSF